ncbi:hypothetical protein JK364_36105 [Streptomyces sp. 110]|uniref:Uncharacterized protein n=1 Tax=Streptomyces endocoffeicus TaxID=2898945 RepID=A0ABS1Q062_9ACTN|nr:hypothetical protein [Streptomyces endocoffeicus]MBL1117765.1 hypothetical protein [Streptomyces endocoffeicus]
MISCSDTDIVLAVRGDITPALNRWTRWLRQELGARRHWERLPAELTTPLETTLVRSLTEPIGTR